MSEKISLFQYLDTAIGWTLTHFASKNAKIDFYKSSQIEVEIRINGLQVSFDDFAKQFQADIRTEMKIKEINPEPHHYSIKSEDFWSRKL